jgi:subtilisin family serine protease
MDPIDLTRVRQLMALTSGREAVRIGLVDGAVASTHPDLVGAHMRQLSSAGTTPCKQDSDAACAHGTLVAGVLVARRGALSPSLCPDCTLLIRPVFESHNASARGLPEATPTQLAAAVIDCIEAGARIVNLSLGFSLPTSLRHAVLHDAFDYALARDVIIVAAAGNQGSLGSSSITRHPWVIPVAACDGRGRPLDASNLGASVARNGLMAPGKRITSPGRPNPLYALEGTSLAAAFVTGALALLWSVFGHASGWQMRHAVTRSAQRSTRQGVVPPLLDAWSSYGDLCRSIHERH